MKAKRKKKLARSHGPQYGAVSNLDRFINHVYRDKKDVEPSKRYRADLMDGKAKFFQTLEAARKFVYQRQNAAARKNTVDGLLEVTNYEPTISIRSNLPVSQAPYPAIQRRVKRVETSRQLSLLNPAVVQLQQEEKPYKGLLQRVDEIETQVAEILIKMDDLYREAAMVRKALLGSK